MSICRRSRKAWKLVNHWAQETYCVLAHHLGERLEALSDRLAEKRYRSERHSEPVRSAAIPGLPKIQLPKYRVINGYKYER